MSLILIPIEHTFVYTWLNPYPLLSIVVSSLLPCLWVYVSHSPSRLHASHMQALAHSWTYHASASSTVPKGTADRSSKATWTLTQVSLPAHLSASWYATLVSQSRHIKRAWLLKGHAKRLLNHQWSTEDDLFGTTGCLPESFFHLFKNSMTRLTFWGISIRH